MLKYERLVRRREALIHDKATNRFEHESLPVRKTEAHLRKPAGQAGNSGNSEGRSCCPILVNYVENLKAVCRSAIRRDGRPVSRSAGICAPLSFPKT